MIETGPSEKSHCMVHTMTLPLALSLKWDKDEHFGRGASASDGAISRQAIPERANERACREGRRERPPRWK